MCFNKQSKFESNTVYLSYKVWSKRASVLYKLLWLFSMKDEEMDIELYFDNPEKSTPIDMMYYWATDKGLKIWLR